MESGSSAWAYTRREWGDRPLSTTNAWIRTHPQTGADSRTRHRRRQRTHGTRSSRPKENCSWTGVPGCCSAHSSSRRATGAGGADRDQPVGLVESGSLVMHIEAAGRVPCPTDPAAAAIALADLVAVSVEAGSGMGRCPVTASAQTGDRGVFPRRSRRIRAAAGREDCAGQAAPRRRPN